MIVCSDADIDDAAKGAVIGSCMNAGQYCCGTERIYVVEDVYDEFVEKVVHETKQLINPLRVFLILEQLFGINN